ncbi:uncharacterized protein [Oscarella lobularis]|uniref:uncharacterized protein isoform X5 n=1 Tax=Oscarella lobularis TaxID=121494 RepID=UPI0033135C76
MELSEAEMEANGLDIRQAYQMLQTWQRKKGPAATVRDLVRALLEEGMRLTAEEVFGTRIYSEDDIDGTIYKQNNIDEDIYQKALAFGSVPVNRYRVMVVGQDGAGKSCLIDSFLGRPFKAKNPSTDGVAIHMAVTAAEGKEGQHTWTEENDKAQHLKDLLAAGYVFKKKDQKSNPTEAVSRLEPAEHTTEFDIKKLADSEYLKSDEALAALKKCEVNQKLLWDLGGQEMYLASHAALMPAESDYT